MSKSINDPWQFKGTLNEIAGNSNTNQQAIISSKAKTISFIITALLILLVEV